MRKDMTKTFLLILMISLTIKFTGQSWTNVGSGLNLTLFQAYDLQKHNSKLFAATRTGSHIWDGTNWIYKPTGIGWTLSLAEYRDTVFISGDFYSNNTQIARVQKFDGSNWNPVIGVFNHPSFCSIKSIIVHNNKLFAGGQFEDNEGFSMKNIGSFNGIYWDTVGAGLNGMVCNLSTHNGSLVACGFFTASANDTSVKYIASWNGLNWNKISSSYSFKTPSCGPSFSFNNKLLIGNIWDTINSIPMKGIACWDGTSYSSMGHVNISGVNSFLIFNNQLFMSASYSGQSVVLKWDGINWEQIGGDFNNDVFTLENYTGELFAGGRFSKCDGTNMSGVAKTSIPLTINKYSTLKGLSYFPNPTHNNLTITFDNSLLVNITNSIGQNVKTFNFSSGTNSISLSDIPKGIYFIKFHSDNQTLIEKLIID